MERPLKILVVDDEPLVRKLYVQALENAGFEVADHAEPHGLGVALFQHQPDVVVVDLEFHGQRGERMLADALLACGDALLRRPRIVLVSGHDTRTVTERGRAIGADAAISKAQPLADLIQACRGRG